MSKQGFNPSVRHGQLASIASCEKHGVFWVSLGFSFEGLTSHQSSVFSSFLCSFGLSVGRFAWVFLWFFRSAGAGDVPAGPERGAGGDDVALEGGVGVWKILEGRGGYPTTVSVFLRG